MKNFFLGLLAACGVLVVGFSTNVIAPHSANPAPLGASSGPDFFNGISATKYMGINSVSASTTTSTVASAVALKDGAHGQITLGTGTPATNLFRASTTAVTAKSMVFLQQTDRTSLAGVTCNATQATNTLVSTVASSTNNSMNGFTITVGGIPTTNPLCFNYWVFDRDR